MNIHESVTLEGFVRQAEYYGTEEVFETALDEGLGLRDLGRLALRLQNIDPSWKLTLDCQQLFLVALLYRQVVGIKDAARMAGVSLSTARAWYEDWQDGEFLEDLETTPDVALQATSKSRFESLRGIVRGWHRTS